MKRTLKTLGAVAICGVLTCVNGLASIYPLPDIGTNLYIPEYWSAASPNYISQLNAHLRQDKENHDEILGILHRKNNRVMADTGVNSLLLIESREYSSVAPDVLIANFAKLHERCTGMLQSVTGSGVRYKQVASRALHFDRRLNAVWFDYNTTDALGPVTIRTYGIVTRSTFVIAIAYADADNAPVILPEVQDMVSSLEIPVEIKMPAEWTKVAETLIDQLKSNGGDSPSKALPANWSKPM